MKKIWDVVTYFIIAILIACAVGGCVAVDYNVFKAKFPNAGPGSYIWHSITRK